MKSADLLFVTIFVYFISICTSVALYTSKSPVKVISTAGEFRNIKEGNDVWLVEFFASWCGHCKAFVSDYERSAKALSGTVKVGAVEEQSLVASEGVGGFPTIKLYLGKGGGIVDYKGSRTASALVDWVIQQVGVLAKKRLGGGKGDGEKSQKNKRGLTDVIEITDSNFKSMVEKDENSVWFLEFYAPWCGHCKSLAPIWEEVATKLKGKVKVAKVDATVQTVLASRFLVKGFPTLILLPAGPKNERSAVPYDGNRGADDIVKHALGFAGQSVKSSQLLSNQQFKDECKSGVCMLAFLPHILDSQAKGRKDYIKKYDGAVKASIGMPVKFFWLQGGDNYHLEEQIHLQFGWPAVVATNLEKGKYSIHRGDFSTESLRGFIGGLMSGRSPLETLPEDLKPFTDMDKWDGKDASVESLEFSGEKDEL